jgi:histidinol phosphatase-like enzyme
MLQKAIAKHHLKASECLMIGDHDRDMEAASLAGVKGIRIQPNAPKYHLLKEEILKIIE